MAKKRKDPKRYKGKTNSKQDNNGRLDGNEKKRLKNTKASLLMAKTKTKED